MIDEQQTIAGEQQVEIIPHLSPQMVSGNSEQLHMLVSNLLNNAVVYSHPGGKVTVDLTAENDQVKLRISDQGIGIAAKHLDKIFDEHFSADNAVRHNKRSTGLGLSIVKSVLHHHQAKIEVTSELEQGSTFTVFFKQFGRKKCPKS